MSKIRNIIVATVLLVTASGTLSNNSLDAQNYYTTDCGGWGYENSISTPSLTPYIVLGTVLAIGIIALAVRHHGHHGHASHGAH